MTNDIRTIEDVARTIAPTAVGPEHLCATGRGTFRVATDTDDPDYALKVVGPIHSGLEQAEPELARLSRIRHPNVGP